MSLSLLFPAAGGILLINGHHVELLVTAAIAAGLAFAAGFLAGSPTPERSAGRLALWSGLVGVEAVALVSPLTWPLVLVIWIYVVRSVWRRWEP